MRDEQRDRRCDGSAHGRCDDETTATRHCEPPRRIGKWHTVEAIGRRSRRTSCERRVFRVGGRHVARTACADTDASLRQTLALRQRARSMAADESSGVSFYLREPEYAATRAALLPVLALRHALFQLVAASIRLRRRNRSVRLRWFAHAFSTRATHASPHRCAAAARCIRNVRRARTPPRERAPPLTSKWFRARCLSCAVPSIRSRPSRSPSRPR